MVCFGSVGAEAPENNRAANSPMLMVLFPTIGHSWNCRLSNNLTLRAHSISKISSPE